MRPERKCGERTIREDEGVYRLWTSSSQCLNKATKEGKRYRLPTRGLMMVRAGCGETLKSGAEGTAASRDAVVTRRVVELDATRHSPWQRYFLSV